MHGAASNGETTETAWLSGRAIVRQSWSVSEVRASRSRRDLPTDFRVAPDPSPEVELSILAENSLFFEKNFPVRPPKLPVPLLKFGHLFPSLGLRTWVTTLYGCKTRSHKLPLTWHFLGQHLICPHPLPPLV